MKIYTSPKEMIDRIATLEKQVAALTEKIVTFQADNARLREALAGLRKHSLCPDTMVRLLDTPLDDSALQERLKAEGERAVREYITGIKGA